MVVEVDPLPDADAAELADLAGLLRAELLDADIEAVELAREEGAPPGAKAVDALAVGQLVVALSQSLPVLRSVVATVRDWVSLRRVRSVKIQLDGDVLEITQVSGEEQRRLIDAWIARHVAPPVSAQG
jgi:hypothetical protein